jgi:hypothetical protein
VGPMPARRLAFARMVPVDELRMKNLRRPRLPHGVPGGTVHLDNASGGVR